MKSVYGILAVAALAVMGWLYVNWTQSRLDSARSDLRVMEIDRDRWQASANTWKEQSEALIREKSEERKAAQELRARLAESSKSYDALRLRIRSASADSDGEVAPVLRETLEALQ